MTSTPLASREALIATPSTAVTPWPCPGVSPLPLNLTAYGGRHTILPLTELASRELLTCKGFLAFAMLRLELSF